MYEVGNSISYNIACAPREDLDWPVLLPVVNPCRAE